jgi:hypothetical protein
MRIRLLLLFACPVFLSARVGYYPVLYRYQPETLFWGAASPFLKNPPPVWKFSASRLWESAWLGAVETGMLNQPIALHWFASDPQTRRDAWDRDLGTFQPLFLSLSMTWETRIPWKSRPVLLGIRPMLLTEQLDQVRAVSLGAGLLTRTWILPSLWAQVRISPLALEIYSTSANRVRPPLRVDAGVGYDQPTYNLRAGWEGGTEQQGALSFGAFRWVHPRVGMGLSYTTLGSQWKTGASSDLFSGLGLLLAVQTRTWMVTYAWRSSGLLGDQHFLGLSFAGHSADRAFNH